MVLTVFVRESTFEHQRKGRFLNDLIQLSVKYAKRTSSFFSCLQIILILCLNRRISNYLTSIFLHYTKFLLPVAVREPAAFLKPEAVLLVTRILSAALKAATTQPHCPEVSTVKSALVV